MAKRKKSGGDDDFHSHDHFRAAVGDWFAVCNEDENEFSIHRVIGWMTHYLDRKATGVTPVGELGHPLLGWSTNYMLSVAGHDLAPDGRKWIEVYNGFGAEFDTRYITELMTDSGKKPKKTRKAAS